MAEFTATIDPSQKFIWRYSALYPEKVPTLKYHLSSDLTPLINIDDLWFKREDTLLVGSVKERGIAYQLADAATLGEKELVISSSGNAALAAAAYCDLYNIKLTVFISAQTMPQKKESLLASAAKVIITPKPLAHSLRYAQENKIRHLRQSRDEKAVWGCMSLGFELFEQLGQKLTQADIFLPVSSATTLVGLGRALQLLVQHSFMAQLPRLHATQTVAINPIARAFVAIPNQPTSGLGLASALCAPQTPRKNEAVSLIKQSQGNGWIITEAEIAQTQQYLIANDLNTSAEGAVACAAALKQVYPLPIVVLTGKNYAKNN